MNEPIMSIRTGRTIQRPLPVTLGWILLLDPHYGGLNQLLLWLPFIERAPFSIYSIGGIMWVHLTLTTIPVMTILLMPALRQFDAAIEESSRVCGSGPCGTLRRITLPLLSPTILTVTIAGLIRSLEAFEIEQLLGTPAGIDVYSTRIFEMISWEPPRFPAAMALSTFFLAVLFVLALFYQRFTRKREFTTIGTRGVSLRPIMVGRWRYIASAFCLTCSGLWIVLPVLMLIIGSFMRLYGFFSINAPFTPKHWMSTFSDPLLLICLKNSLIVALAVGVIGLAVYATIAYVVVRTTIPARSAISILAWLPWAVPGILLGVALLWLLLSLPGMSIFYGTFVPLILVLIVKEMPIGTHMMKTALGQISKELEEASWVCGASRFTTFRRISLPLITPTLVSIFAIVLIAALRDISTTILLVTANTRSLAILMMEYSRGGQLEVASIIGVLITTVAILMAMVARRVGLRMSMEV